MKNTTRALRSWLLNACLLLGLIGLVAAAPSTLFAQAAAAADSAASASEPVTDMLAGLLGKHAWLSTVLAIYGALSAAYNAVITWAHKRAAETSDPADDAWIAKLEAKWWFRLLDRVFYFGGYLGAKLGGKKL